MRLALAALAGTSLLAGCASVDTSAPAGEAEAALAAMNRSMVGSWTGRVERLDPATGETEETADAFAFAVISDDGLDFAFWRAGGLTLSEHQGAGRYIQRSWSADGALTVDEVQSSDMTGPDATGRWTLTETSTVTDDAGDAIEVRTRYVFEPPVLTSVGEQRPAGSGAAFAPVSAGEWTLQP